MPVACETARAAGALKRAMGPSVKPSVPSPATLKTICTT
jgi:hypothetical protein